MKKLFKGNIVFTKSKDEFTSYEGGYLALEDGKVVYAGMEIPESFKDVEVQDKKEQLIIPSFVDLHLHGPQFANCGIGYDEQLLEWLEKYTFKEESKFSDLEYAEEIWKDLINELWACGTLRSVVFSSRHYEATRSLLNLFIESKLGAHVGKVVMDRNSPDYYIDNTKETIEENLKLIDEFHGKNDKVDVILTPRFVPTCTEEVMDELGKISCEKKIPVQSHINESLGEIAWVKELHPEDESYGAIYERHNLFGRDEKCIMAHCIYNTEKEIDMMDRNFYPVHCPESNANLLSGIMDVKTLLNKGIKVSLGSDISGGQNIFMPRQIALCVQLSKMKGRMEDDISLAISASEAFFMATKNGGDFFGKVGSFEEGFSGDFLIVDVHEIMAPREKRTPTEALEKWLYMGEKYNIKERYIQGEEIKKPF